MNSNARRRIVSSSSDESASERAAASKSATRSNREVMEKTEAADRCRTAGVPYVEFSKGEYFWWKKRPIMTGGKAQGVKLTNWKRPGGFRKRPGGFKKRPGGFRKRPGGFRKRPGGFRKRPGGLRKRPGGFS
uniref:Uncharacterized protein n=1 Tax=Globodera rostochiensis TaxID=31243 RepID=A0A914HLE9_GLORO